MAPGAVTPRLGLRIAGLGFSFGPDEEGIVSSLRRRYGAFSRPVGACREFEVSSVQRRDLPFRPAVALAGTTLTLKRGDFRAGLDLRTGKGRLAAASDAQCLDAFLRSLLSSLLLRSGGLMLHSAGLLKNGRAYVFLGKSGAGKSTLARLAAAAGGAEVISDEINLLRPGKRGWAVHGSPFWGEMRADGRPGAWPLGGVYILAKARSHSLHSCGGGEALKLLLRCLVNFEKGGEAASLALSNACGLLEAARPKRLEFAKRDAAFLELI
ncbi:MAG: hypothetical protein M0025_01095 [Elusimicrobia bacterium]|nr:hypothetical protein [Elusimicrobiota bacterium]